MFNFAKQSKNMNPMTRRFKTIGMMLISAGICTGTSPAAPIHMDGVRITQQSNICTGVVKDTSGEAVIGASITVKGTNNGAITDFNGSFSLQKCKDRRYYPDIFRRI